jgi:LysR family hydrogen peroxide-inducible transcriptional activator
MDPIRGQNSRGNIMTLTQLEYILAVNRYRHFGKAAKACFVTQPTLSMQLQKLEDELEIILFDRSRSPILPTSEGELIIEQAKVVVREQKRILDVIQQARNQLGGDFRLGVIPTLSTYILPLFLRDFVESYSGVNLIIEELKTEDITRLLAEDEMDAFYLFVAPGHELSKKTKIKQDDLKLEEIWLLDKGNCFRDQVLKICSEGKNGDRTAGRIRFESGNLETLKNMVLTSSGYTILPHLAVNQLSPDKRQLVREFYDPVPTREVSLVYGRSVLRERVIDALENQILEALPKELRALDRKAVEVVEIT